jgi:hypothetical protein
MNKYHNENNLIFESYLNRTNMNHPESYNNTMPDGSITNQIKYIRDIIAPLLETDKRKALMLFNTMPNHERDTEMDMYQFIRTTTNGVTL